MHIRRMIEESTGARSEGKNVAVLPSTITTTPSSAIVSLDSRGNAADDENEDDERSIGERLTYATIDSLALKRARLPLQLVPIEDDARSEDRSVSPAIDSTSTVVPTNRSKQQTPRRPSCRARPAGPGMMEHWKCRSRSKFQLGTSSKIGNDSESRYRSMDDESPSLVEKRHSHEENSIEPSRIFDRSKKIVQHPTVGRREDDRIRAAMKKSRPSRQNRPEDEQAGHEAPETDVPRHLNPEEIIYRRPAFASVEKDNSADELESLSNGTEVSSKNAEMVNQPETRSDVEDDDAPVYEAVAEYSTDSLGSSFPRHSANASFLWRNAGSRRTPVAKTAEACSNADAVEISNDTDGAKIDRSIETEQDCDDTYDDVGLSPCNHTEEDNYDDVGPPQGFVTSVASSMALLVDENLDEEDCELYDDVVPAPTTNDASPTVNGTTSTGKLEDRRGRSPGQERDDSDGWSRSIDNDYSSVDEETTLEDRTYDDVRLVPSRQERVNSLYAGSGSRLGFPDNGGESEWEDLDDNSVIASRRVDLPSHSPGRKKMIQRRSRNVRRHRSKVTNRRSPLTSRSTSRTPVRADTVAVSLGTGSILLVGGPAVGNDDENRDLSLDDSPSLVDNATLATRGLVQLRILGKPDEDSVDTQETSCYVLEDTASDDSNYETLISSLPSDESSEAIDDEDSSWQRISVSSGRVDPVIVREEAPSRPVPPPPRESSLTETLGRRMRMLRRTWSITKGSLGRMRGRASSTSNPDDSVNNAGCGSRERAHPGNDGRCYFGLKRRFGKSVTGLSTFYLGTNDAVDEVRDNLYDDAGYRRNNGNDTENRHQSLLDEEPLYQFYAAAAARVAFESDSEGYEEVEDLTPSPSTVDLAKPGHRTLWCQTPRVRSSGLLQSLTPEEKKCQEAKFEILTSEASYLNSLRVLVDEFVSNHDLVYDVLTSSEREKLFGGVPGVLTASECLLGQLENAWREDPMLRGLPEILSSHAEKSSSVYVAYCSNQVSIDATLKELRSRRGSKFVETIARIESRSACHSLSLHSFLMLPMQRVTRLPLLADAVSSRLSSEKADERERWEGALSRLSRVVEECNEAARAAGRRVEMEALERKLVYSPKVPPIVLRDRYLVRRGPVIRIIAKSDVDHGLTFGKKFRKARLYLLLLTDYLLIARSETSGNEETYTVVDTCKRSLVELERISDDSPLAGRCAMVLTLLENHSGRHVEYVLTCEDPTERERWLDAVSPAKPSLLGEESLYETWDCPQVVALYPYAPTQPDELNLQPGDVINVTRKMTDGWYLGEKLLGGEQGWFPGNYAREVASEHVRARNLRQRHRLLALSASVLQQRAKRASR